MKMLHPILILSLNYVQKMKDVVNDIVRLKLFTFSLSDRAKAWFSSLPKNNIDSWSNEKMLSLLKKSSR